MRIPASWSNHWFGVENFSGECIVFNAVGIELSFARFLEKPFGDRGGLHDADVFRAGEYSKLGELVETIAQHFATRAARIRFAPEESQAGGAQARVEVVIKCLADSGAALKQRQGGEREDFHWEIIGELVGALAAILDHIEGKGGPA